MLWYTRVLELLIVKTIVIIFIHSSSYKPLMIIVFVNGASGGWMVACGLRDLFIL